MIQIRWRQHQKSFKSKLEKLKDIWNNMTLILLNKILEMKSQKLDDKEQGEMYYMQYLDQITEYYSIR